MPKGNHLKLENVILNQVLTRRTHMGVESTCQQLIRMELKFKLENQFNCEIWAQKSVFRFREFSIIRQNAPCAFKSTILRRDLKRHQSSNNFLKKLKKKLAAQIVKKKLNFMIVNYK